MLRRGPICVSYEPPPSPTEALARRERWVRWRPSPFTKPDPVWAAEPDLTLVHQIATKYAQMCDFSSNDISVEFFKEGAFNKFYTISATNTQTGNRDERIIRFSMPIHPWYTIESEVATMEFIYTQTTIPTPKVYLFDSSGENALGLEWVMMEKIDGQTYDSVEAGLSMKQKERVSCIIARWVYQLTTLQFDKIGSLYCRWNPLKKPVLSDFYLGPCSDFQFAYDFRQEYDIPRGPFNSIRDYLQGVVEIYEAETLDPRQRKRSHFWDLFKDFESQGIIHSQRQDLQLWPSIYSKSDLKRIPKYCHSLRYVIPLIAKDTALPPRSTFLHHFDISSSNIIVSDEAIPIVLLDWGQITTRPFSFGFDSLLPRCIVNNTIDQDYITMTSDLQISDTPAHNLHLKQVYMEFLQRWLPLMPFENESDVINMELKELYEYVVTIPQSVGSEGYEFVRDFIEERGMAWLNAPGLGDWKYHNRVDASSYESG